MASGAITHRGLFLPVLAALTVLAWGVLWAWERSPYALYLDHSMMRALCLSDGPVAVANIFVLGWVLMTIAMMLPTTFPLLVMFRRLTRERAQPGMLMASLVTGYLAVWIGFGVLAHAVAWLILAGIDRVDALQGHPWALAAAALALAGGFQFSSLKYRCMDKCRNPMSFVLDYWRRQAGRLGAIRLGVWHGAYCVGCCWALMSLMLFVGAGNVGWMLVLGAVMAAEKNLPQGHLLSPLVGTACLAWATGIAIEGVA